MARLTDETARQLLNSAGFLPGAEGLKMAIVTAPPQEQPITEEELDRAASELIVGFLSEVNPEALEVAALARVGGLEGDESVGQAFLNALKDMASGGS